MRCTVSASNTSAAKRTVADSSAPSSERRKNSRSNLAEPLPRFSTGPKTGVAPAGAPEAASSVRQIWKRGCRASDRAGLTASRTTSNGAS